MDREKRREKREDIKCNTSGDKIIKAIDEVKDQKCCGK